MTKNQAAPELVPIVPTPELDQIADLKQRLEIQEAELAEYRQMVQAHEDFLNDNPDAKRDAQVLVDPYFSQDPFKIIGEIPPSQEYPEGQVLGWKNPRYRQEKRGWRGWIPLEYDDEYAGKGGALLSRYIPDPPARMIGPDKVDNYVRRGDTVLCRIDKRFWKARLERQSRTSKDRLAATAKNVSFGEGVETVGPGLKTQRNPKLREKLRELNPGETRINMLTGEQERG